MKDEKTIKNKEEIQDIERYVGNRLKTRRHEIGISQAKLGELVDITFQQIQKYEKGENRISSARLYIFAKALNVDVSYFFKGYSMQKKPVKRIKINFTREKKLVKLVEYFNNISDEPTAKAIVDMVKKLSNVKKE